MSLPELYTTHLETLADSTGSSGKPLTTHNLITKAINIYYKHQLCARWDAKSGNKDSAFQTSDHKGKGKKGQKPRKDVECYNCHKKGHFSCDCYVLGGAKEGQGPLPKKGGQKPKEGSANVTNNVPDGTWSTITNKTPLYSSIKNPKIYLEEVDNDNTNEISDAECGPVSKPAATKTTHTTMLHPPTDSHTPELYDSGATCHPPVGILTNY